MSRVKSDWEVTADIIADMSRVKSDWEVTADLADKVLDERQRAEKTEARIEVLKVAAFRYIAATEKSIWERNYVDEDYKPARKALHEALSGDSVSDAERKEETETNGSVSNEHAAPKGERVEVGSDSGSACELEDSARGKGVLLVDTRAGGRDGQDQGVVARSSEALHSAIEGVLRRYEITNVEPELSERIETLRAAAISAGVFPGEPHEVARLRPNEASRQGDIERVALALGLETGGDIGYILGAIDELKAELATEKEDSKNFSEMNSELLAEIVARTDKPCAPSDDAWKEEEDKPLPEDDKIHRAFPTRSGRHDLYAEAMRLVGARYSKAGLVALVNWLLHERIKAGGQ